MNGSTWDVIIIGAGAAGLMCGIRCGQSGLKTLVLDSQSRVGAKILMSGGTRCNVTNEEIRDLDYSTSYPRKGIHHVLSTMRPEQIIDFFAQWDVPLKREPGGKLFPITDSAASVLNALLTALQQSGSRLENPRKVSHIEKTVSHYVVSGSGFNYKATCVVLCTGGLSYPTTGSDGTGYNLAQSLGHHKIPTLPALTPFLSASKDYAELSGITLPVTLSLYHHKKKIQSFTDSFLFTHFGFSGPAALNMSRHWLRAKESFQEALRLEACFLPNVQEDTLKDNIDTARKQAGLQLRSLLCQSLPERLVDLLLKITAIRPDLSINQTPKEMLRNLLNGIYRHELPIHGVYGYKKAEVTAGGIDLAEINLKRMESKFHPGLFFAGEILDVDGKIGGYNFQWAWSSAAAAARGVFQRVHGTINSDTVDN